MFHFAGKTIHDNTRIVTDGDKVERTGRGNCIERKRELED